jgi:single-strand DNA-binding protein
MNSVNLIGRLTADPEARTTASGTPVTGMRLAIARRPKAGEDRGAVFIDITAWDKLGELCAEHLTKGRQVAISGRLELDEWTAGDGTKRQRHHVVAEAVEFLGAKPEGPETASDEESPAPARRSRSRKADNEGAAA